MRVLLSGVGRLLASSEVSCLQDRMGLSREPVPPDILLQDAMLHVYRKAEGPAARGTRNMVGSRCWLACVACVLPSMSISIVAGTCALV